MKTCLYFVFICFVFLSCVKRKCPKDYLVYGNVEPYSTDYKVGDTIQFYIKNYSGAVYEEIYKEYFPLKGRNLISYLRISKIDSSEIFPQTNLSHYVNVLLEDSIYIFINADSSVSYRVPASYVNDSIYVSISIIPRKEGIYYANLGLYGSGRSSCNIGIIFGDDCDTNNFYITTIMNKGKDNNLELLRKSYNSQYNEWVFADKENRFHRKGSFAFRVKPKIIQL